MKVFQKYILIFIIIQTFHPINVYAIEKSYIKGMISGQLDIDSSWNPVVYISYIPSFSDMNAISNNMIISEAPLDSFGNFNIDISFLPMEEKLFRLHLVKKDYPPTTLIIGGKDQNHLFFLANHDANIKIVATSNTNLFENVRFEGFPDNITFQQITNIVATSNKEITTVKSLSKKELIENATSERLRYIADTCKNPLVSLYAIYESGFESNYLSNASFYKSYYKKWENNNSTYFQTFRNKLPISEDHIEVYILIATFIVCGIFLFYRIIQNKKSDKLKKLSIQERKIFALLQEGLTNQQISDECNIGLSTVKSHLSSTYSKLKIKSRKEATNFKK